MYTDEGISATDTSHRSGFNQMVQDALDGKIDLIVTKSVNRFARKTVDSLTTVRKLKEKGVMVYFQKENIYTPDTKGELLITIMSSLAQGDYRRKYAGYADRYTILESRMDGLKKAWERRRIQHDLFSGFLSELEEVRGLSEYRVCTRCPRLFFSVCGKSY